MEAKVQFSHVIGNISVSVLVYVCICVFVCVYHGICGDKYIIKTNVKVFFSFIIFLLVTRWKLYRVLSKFEERSLGR